MISHNWTDDRVEELKRRWIAGESCSEIGGAMGISRNAVIGKVHRIGLDPRKGTKSPQELELARRRAEQRKVENRRNARRRAREEQMQEAIAAMPVFSGYLSIPFADLRDFSSSEMNQCRFIAAEPPGPDYPACGNETLPGESYCPHCKAITQSGGARTHAERALHVRLGIRRHLKALMQVA